MNERREQTVITDTNVMPEHEQMPRGEDGSMRERGTGGMSTAEMAAAMEQRGDGSTSSVAGAMDQQGKTLSDERNEPLFPGDDAQNYRSRWTDIQTGFVDEPGRAVEQADELVAEVIQRLAQVFAEARENLESQWGRGGDVDTESLRLALRRYRSFFERLLSA